VTSETTARSTTRYVAEINVLNGVVGALSVLLAVSVVAGRRRKGGA
jgi:hypothetical protein